MLEQKKKEITERCASIMSKFNKSFMNFREERENEIQEGIKGFDPRRQELLRKLVLLGENEDAIYLGLKDLGDHQLTSLEAIVGSLTIRPKRTMTFVRLPKEHSCGPYHKRLLHSCLNIAILEDSDGRPESEELQPLVLYRHKRTDPVSRKSTLVPVKVGRTGIKVCLNRNFVT